MADDVFLDDEAPRIVDALDQRLRDLQTVANGFARAMSGAFASSVSGGRQFDDVLKSLALRMSDLTLRAALTPVTRGLTEAIGPLLGGLFTAQPFAQGGVINTPSYFPLNGGLGLAGEAGPEAILPLARGPDGRLGVAAGGAAQATQVTIHIATPDADSFRRSESYLTGQIARAVARGQRSR